jgi:hypothetical protein
MGLFELIYNYLYSHYKNKITTNYQIGQYLLILLVFLYYNAPKINNSIETSKLPIVDRYELVRE